MNLMLQRIYPNTQQLVKLDACSNQAPWHEQHYIDSLNAGHQFWGLLDVDNTQLYGFAVCLLVMDEVELLNLVIDRAYQRQGFGRQLLQALQKELRQQGRRRILLEVRANNTAAKALYLSCGGNEQGLRQYYYPPATIGGKREHAILMEIVL